jgi:hypothetical protein
MDSECFLGRSLDWTMISSCLPLFICRPYDGVAGACEFGEEPSGSIKRGAFLD